LKHLSSRFALDRLTGFLFALPTGTKNNRLLHTPGDDDAKALTRALFPLAANASQQAPAAVCRCDFGNAESSLCCVEYERALNRMAYA